MYACWVGTCLLSAKTRASEHLEKTLTVTSHSLRPDWPPAPSRGAPAAAAGRRGGAGPCQVMVLGLRAHGLGLRTVYTLNPKLSLVIVFQWLKASVDSGSKSRCYLSTWSPAALQVYPIREDVFYYSHSKIEGYRSKAAWHG